MWSNIQNEKLSVVPVNGSSVLVTGLWESIHDVPGVHGVPFMGGKKRGQKRALFNRLTGNDKPSQYKGRRTALRKKDGGEKRPERTEVKNVTKEVSFGQTTFIEDNNISQVSTAKDLPKEKDLPEEFELDELTTYLEELELTPEDFDSRDFSEVADLLANLEQELSYKNYPLKQYDCKGGVKDRLALIARATEEESFEVANTNHVKVKKYTLSDDEYVQILRKKIFTSEEIEEDIQLFEEDYDKIVKIKQAQHFNDRITQNNMLH